MKKRLPMRSLKKKAWKLFSEYIRRKEADPDGNVICVACGRRAHWKTLQASHLVPGRRLGILFDERGVWPCCMGCNVFKNGNYREYDAFLDERFGQEYRINLVEELRRLSKQPIKWSRDEFEVIICKYHGLLDKLNERNGPDYQ